MKKYILFAATKRDCSCRFWQQGDWRATSYVLYSDGVCYQTIEREDTPEKTKIFRMDAENFARLRTLLETQFDGTTADWGCDGTQWEMYHFAPSGRLLHRSGMGFVGHVPVLHEIEALLAIQ